MCKNFLSCIILPIILVIHNCTHTALIGMLIIGPNSNLKFQKRNSNQNVIFFYQFISLLKSLCRKPYPERSTHIEHSCQCVPTCQVHIGSYMPSQTLVSRAQHHEDWNRNVRSILKTNFNLPSAALTLL